MMNISNLISGSSAFSKFSLNIWKFSVHVLLKPSLEDFEHYFASMWNECNCAIDWTSLALPFFGIREKTDLSVFIPKTERQKCYCCSVTQLCLTLWDPMDLSTPGFSVLHHLPELAQTHVRWVVNAIQPSFSLLSPSPACNLSQNQGLFQWVISSHQVAKVLALQLQPQSFQWIFRIYFL